MTTSNTGLWLGIDLGTCNSSAAIKLGEGKVETILSRVHDMFGVEDPTMDCGRFFGIRSCCERADQQREENRGT